MKKLELVYIVEDDFVTSFIIQRVVEEHGSFNKSVVFNNGLQALNSYKNDVVKPDVILLDINMPVMDGWEFLEAFSQLPDYENIPVFMLSSSIFPADIEKSQTYSFVKGFIHKPLTLKQLDEIINK